MNERELEFAIFCIENIAASLGKDPVTVYDALTIKSNILDRYIIPNYEVLHSQGKEYIVEDILSVMKDEGVIII